MSSNVRAGVRIVLVASLSGSWRSGITEVFSAIASGVETLIHPRRDLAAGDFIMQMSVSAPVPATVLKRTRGACGWQDTYGLAEITHTPLPPPPQPSPDQLQLSPFTGLTGINGTLKEATAFLLRCPCLYSISRWRLLAALSRGLTFFFFLLEDLLFLFIAGGCCVGTSVPWRMWCLIKKNWKLVNPPLLMITQIQVDI